MQLFLLGRNTNQNHEIEHSPPLTREKNLNPNQNNLQFNKSESFLLQTAVRSDLRVPERHELSSSQDGEDVRNKIFPKTSKSSVTQSWKNLSQTDLNEENKTESFKDSQDFLAIVLQLNKTLQNIKNQEKTIFSGMKIY